MEEFSNMLSEKDREKVLASSRESKHMYRFGMVMKINP